MKGLNKFTSMAIMVIIVILINIISIRMFSRIDLTEEKMYTLSDYTKEVLQTLDDKITIKAYFSKNLPGEFGNTARFLKDELEQYKAYSNGKVQFEFIYIDNEENLKQEAQQFGIRPVNLQDVQNDKLEVRQVYMGVAVLYEDKKEVIPLIQNTKGLEYDLTTAVIKLLSMQDIKIGILTDNGTPEINRKLQKLQNFLIQQYRTMPVSLEENSEGLNNLNTLVIISPKEKFTEKQLYLIDQFIMKGGNVLWAIDMLDTDMQQGKAEKLDLGLSDFLKNYGIDIKTNMVFDKDCATVSVSRRQGFFQIQTPVEYNFIPHITNFNKTHTIVKSLEEAYLFFPSSIDTSYAGKKGIQIDALVSTSENSGSINDKFTRVMNPLSDQFKQLASNYTGSEVLAASYKGNFKSYFSGKSLKFLESEAGIDTTQFKEQTSSEGRLTVITDGEFIQDDNLASESNLILFLNIIDWLNNSEGLISIRSREITFRPLEEISPGAKKFVKNVNLFLSPALLIAFGIIYFRIRNNRKRRGF